MNERIAEKLKESILTGRSMHGYLITGAKSASVSLAEECASLLLFGYEAVDRLILSPDYFRLDGGAKVDDIRSIRRELQTRTYSGDNRAIVIENAHLLNDNANNAMLKMLEEPPAGTYFFLTGDELRMLPTTRSRLNIIRLGQMSVEDIKARLIALGADARAAEEYAYKSAGEASVAVALMTDEAISKQRICAIKTVLTALGGGLDFSSTKELCESRNSALDSIHFMLSVCHDIIAIKAVGNADKDLCNQDYSTELHRIAGGIPLNAITGVIDALSLAQKRLTPAARPQQILDKMLIEIAIAVRETASR